MDKALIANSTQQIQAGVGLVKDAGATLGEIVEAASKVAATVSEISMATTEQSNGIDEMARTVAHMDELTQQNALFAEQGAKVARELRQDTAALSGMVAAFTLEAGVGLDRDARGAGAARRQAPSPERVVSIVPHSSPRSPAASDRTPAQTRRLAAGGAASGWSEF